ncbi:unnamed protein product [Linum trigynum]|uniref:Uncharacterized protein n=1 Tax=Linum trigynum TaxID=586398 RepID=A0AAV2DRX9_9ROSI
MDIFLYGMAYQELTVQLQLARENCVSVLLLIKETFFKHGEKETLRSCVKALNFSSVESKWELKDYACRMSLLLSLDLLSKKLR